MVRSSALAAALFLAGGAVPFVGVAFLIFAPSPVLGYAVGRPRALLRAIGAVALAALLTTLAVGVVQGAAYIIGFGLATVVMVEMLERRQPFERIVLVAAAATIVATAIGLIAMTGSPQALAASVHKAISGAL